MAGKSKKMHFHAVKFDKHLQMEWKDAPTHRSGSLRNGSQDVHLSDTTHKEKIAKGRVCERERGK